MRHVSPALFAALLWGTPGAVVLVFAYLLYAVVRAGGVRLVEDHGPDRPAPNANYSPSRPASVTSASRRSPSRTNSTVTVSPGEVFRNSCS